MITDADCRHDDRVEITVLGDVEPQHLCACCGVVLEDWELAADAMRSPDETL